MTNNEDVNAWIHLQEVGFKFEGWELPADGKPRIYFSVERKNNDDILPDLTRLFGENLSGKE